MRHFLAVLMLILTLAACSAIPATSLPGEIPLPPSTGATPDLPTIVPKLPTIETLLPTNPPVIGEQPMPTFEPLPGDNKLTRGTAIVNSASLLILESYPIQVQLLLYGYLPNPCHQLRVLVNPPDTDKRIDIEVYSVYDAEMLCIEVIKEFETSVSLGSFPAGHYQVFVNGEPAGEFDS